MNRMAWTCFWMLAGLILAVVFSQSASNLTDAKASTIETPQAKKRFELRSINLPDGGVVNFRFNPSTGESWRLMWKADQKAYVWEAVAEPGRIPAGDYDLQIIDSTDTRKLQGGGFFLAYRIDRLSGKTWWHGQGKWTEVVEPK